MASRWFTLERAIALVIFIIALAYINASFNIRMLPFELRQPFKPNTFPLVIGILTAIVSFLVAVIPPRAAAAGEGKAIAGDAEGWRDFDWKRFFIFFGLMLLYATFLRPAGFLPSTIVFLVLGSLVLQEYRVWISIPIIFVLTVGLWYLVTKVLGIYMPAMPDAHLLGKMFGLAASAGA